MDEGTLPVKDKVHPQAAKSFNMINDRHEKRYILTDHEHGYIIITPEQWEEMKRMYP